MDSFAKEIKANMARALGIDIAVLDDAVDEEAAARFSQMLKADKRKVTCGLALLQLQIPDEVRYELLTNHLDKTDEFIRTSFEELAARLVNVVQHEPNDVPSSLLGSVRLAMLMNILGFDDNTLRTVLNDPDLSKKAAAYAHAGMTEIAQNIQQMKMV